MLQKEIRNHTKIEIKNYTLLTYFHQFFIELDTFSLYLNSGRGYFDGKILIVDIEVRNIFVL